MKNKATYISWAIIALPIILYFYFLAEYSQNIPKWDDHALKAFILNYENADGFWAKFQTFFVQHNEHRIAFDRLITLIVYKINGTIDYRWLMWVGNFTLIGVLMIFREIFQKQQISTFFLVPIAFLLFQLQLWENTFWGMAAVQNFGVIFFILGLIYFISSPRKIDFYWAILFAFWATYTSGNGITAFPVCIFLLILQRRFTETFIFGFISIALICLYFYHYQMPPSNPPMRGIGIGKIIFGYFSFLGSSFDLIPSSSGRIKLTILAGGILSFFSVIIAIYLIFSSKLLKKNRFLTQSELFILGSLIFLLGTGLVVTVTRISFGEIGLLTSRYKIYAILLVITLYTFIISKIELSNSKWIIILLILISIGFNIIANYTHFKEVVNFRNQLISFGMNWKLENIKPSNSLYETPTLAIEKDISTIQKPLKFVPLWKNNLKKQKHDNGILLESTNTNHDYQPFIIVQSPKRIYLMPTQLNNYPINAFVRTGNYWQKGFSGELNYNEFDNGVYQLGLYFNNKTYYLNDSLIVNNTKPRNVKTNW